MIAAAAAAAARCIESHGGQFPAGWIRRLSFYLWRSRSNPSTSARIKPRSTNFARVIVDTSRPGLTLIVISAYRHWEQLLLCYRCSIFRRYDPERLSVLQPGPEERNGWQDDSGPGTGYRPRMLPIARYFAEVRGRRL